jgi:ribosomal protein L31
MNGKDSIYRRYIRRAQNYKNLFDPQTGHMRGKVQGIWYSPFEPSEINNFFTEGNSWQYSFYVPQDITGLMNLHGGKEKFFRKLERLTNTDEQLKGREQPDVTGLIGQYAHGNEPSHHMAYLFNYAGKPWFTQWMVARIMQKFYKNAPDGLIGNEDCGQMSAWYVFSALGFYPVTPGSGQYAIGTPRFTKATIHLENGKQFVIERNTPSDGPWIKEMKLNGSDYKKYFLEHAQIMKGGKLYFQTGPPNHDVQGYQMPETSIKDEQIVPVPYFTNNTYKFRDSVRVELKNVDPAAQIHFVVNPKGEVVEYETGSSFLLTDTATIEIFATKGNEVSGEVRQKFHKMVSDRTISVKSKVHPMYTAGGPDALIDGIIGTTNWKTGEWHSYFDTDLEAIIDLKQDRKINYVGVHVLQDPSPWILYPSEVIYYASPDGENYKEVARVRNTVGQDIKNIETQMLGADLNINARYIKVKAINAGKLPAWHESAGNPSHLFIDEIVVK